MTQFSLAHIAETPHAVEHLFWNVPIPSGVDAEQITFDERNFHRARRLAGITDIIFANERDPEQEKVEPHMVGLMPTPKKPPASKRTVGLGTLDRGEPGIFDAMSMAYLPDLTIPIGNNRIVQTLGSSKAKTYTEHYAQEISRAYRRNMFEASLKSNVEDHIIVPHDIYKRSADATPKVFARFLPAMCVANTVSTLKWGFAVASEPGMQSLLSFAEIIGTNTACAFGLSKMMEAKRDDEDKTPILDYKWTLFGMYGFKLDRFIVSAIENRLSKPLLKVKK